MKSKIFIFLVISLFIAGLFFIFYPAASNYWNNMHQSKVIANHIEKVDVLESSDYSDILREAIKYNEDLAKSGGFKMTRAQLERYNNTLNVSSDGIMGYVEIPKINIKLAIYHGTSDEVLQVAVGHMEGSSLPVGGESTHTILLGHRGLPTAKLFTNLDKMEEGDIFYINSLDRKLAYQVDKISVVEPDELDNIQIEDGKDYATLVTCTPYGVNTHRLLVRGQRIEVNQSEVKALSAITLQNRGLNTILIITVFTFVLCILLSVKIKNIFAI